MKDHIKTIGYFGIYIVISIGCTSIIPIVGSKENYQSILLGILVFLCLTSIHIIFHKKIWKDTHDRVKKILDAQERIEKISPNIKEISDNMKTIAVKYYKKSPLFEKWYGEQLGELRNHTIKTAEEGSFYFKASRLKEQDEAFNVFDGRKSDYLWVTCTDISWFESHLGEIFLRGIYGKFNDGKITEVKRLYIYDEESCLSKFKVELFFYLHETSQWKYKVIAKNNFNSTVKTFGHDDWCIDFGIYGKEYLWKTDKIEKGGYMCADASMIAQYTKLYDSLWESLPEYKINNEEIVKNYSNYKIYDYRRLIENSNG